MVRPALRVDRSGAPLRLLHVHAHPDDESSKGAATTAKYVAEGVEVMVATCTGGERGSILNPRMDRPDVLDNIAEIRKQEMDRAREILGIQQVWLGFVDSGLPEGDPLPPLPPGCFATVDLEVEVAALVRVIREFRPHVMTTYDEKGGYPHPDHVRCHQVSVAAFEQAGDPHALEEFGPAWQVQKLYYHLGGNRKRLEALDAAMVERGLEPQYTEWLKRWPADPPARPYPVTRVPCAEYFPVRDDALLAHATQIDPDGHWFSIPQEIHQSVWPTEDYELVTSHVEVTQPEDDLFAGIAVAGAADAAPSTVSDRPETLSDRQSA